MKKSDLQHLKDIVYKVESGEIILENLGLEIFSQETVLISSTKPNDSPRKSKVLETTYRLSATLYKMY